MAGRLLDGNAAGRRRDAVDQHDARAADSVAAAVACAGQPEIVAQHSEERGARLSLDVVYAAIDLEPNAHHRRSILA
jgi:hypothetical protein